MIAVISASAKRIVEQNRTDSAAVEITVAHSLTHTVTIHTYVPQEADGLLAHGVAVADVRPDHLVEGFLDALCVER